MNGAMSVTAAFFDWIKPLRVLGQSETPNEAPTGLTAGEVTAAAGAKWVWDAVLEGWCLEGRDVLTSEELLLRFRPVRILGVPVKAFRVRQGSRVDGLQVSGELILEHWGRDGWPPSRTIEHYLRQWELVAGDSDDWHGNGRRPSRRAGRRRRT